MKKRSFISIVLLLALCLSLTGCLEDLPVSDLPQTTTAPIQESVTDAPTTLPTKETEPTTTPTEPTTAPTEPTTEPTEPVHLHEYLAATCTAPKTCQSCGETVGSALGHKWKDATCSEPKTCSVCGTTSGLTAGHNFHDGECTACGKSDPGYVAEVMVWIPTKGGKKYHSKSSCSNMDNPQRVTISEAKRQGFTACKKCYK